MGEFTAMNEYCAECGGLLGSVRYLILTRLGAEATFGPLHAAVHPACREAFAARQNPPQTTDTTARRNPHV